jgi:tetratricopeptide (TPR) repeat protein
LIRASVFLLWFACLAHGQQQAVRPGDLAGAEQSLEQFLKTQPTGRGWERLGLIRHLQNKYEEAIPAFREALRRDPRLWTAHLFLGICLYRTNQFAAALASLQTAERVAPKQAAGRDELEFWLGATQIALKKPLEGLEILERLLQRNPLHAEAVELVVRTAAAAAAEEWNKVAETHFETSAGYEVHGHALESEGKRPAALEAFRKARELNPRRAGPGLAIGRLLLTGGKASEAFEVLRLEVKLAGCDPAAFHYAALAALQSGHPAEAAALLEAAVKWPARNPEAPLALAQVYLALGEVQKAVAVAREAAAAAPSSAAAHDVLMAALDRAGLTEEREAERRRWKQ